MTYSTALVIVSISGAWVYETSQINQLTPHPTHRVFENISRPRLSHSILSTAWMRACAIVYAPTCQVLRGTNLIHSQIASRSDYFNFARSSQDPWLADHSHTSRLPFIISHVA
ncbi:hypothetical protein BJY01DRAFT_26014 [Aspergillus pseudoustus]|uniref:Uncharacterized protein n=1 Tax=Aspergillus pseudoustus TaxID=1810923 RepID=A0ABR4KRI6_9EURO